MSKDVLFEGGDERVERARDEGIQRTAKLQRPDRAQSTLSATSIDELIPSRHRARLFWGLLEGLDLSAFRQSIRSKEGLAGRPAFDPRMLLCLWLFATSEGVGSAREIERLCERDSAYRWICGGLQPCYRTLSAFRVAHGTALDDLMTQLLVALMATGKVQLRRVAQDGCRVRANAGASSFHRGRGLELQARIQVAQTRAQVDAPVQEESKQQRTARIRADREHAERLEQAKRELEKVRRSQSKKPPEEVRVSTTDPECRVMRMADNGFRPAYNVQGCVDTESRVIVGVAVTNSGSDLNQMAEMVDQVRERAKEAPKQVLVDAGYAKKEAIERLEGEGVEVFAPQQKNRKNPAEPRWDDGPGVVNWRKRMTTPEGAEIYKDRGSTIELVFGDLRRWRGMTQLPVRGIRKGRSVALLFALTYNFMRTIALGGLT